MWGIHRRNPRSPHWLIRESTVKTSNEDSTVTESLTILGDDITMMCEVGMAELKGNDEDLTVRIDTYIQLKGLE